MSKNVRTYQGIDLFPWQLSVHKGLLSYGIISNHIHVVKSKRQVGNSLLMLGELLYSS